MTLRQRQPRIEDAAWLAIVRKMPCLVCGYPRSDPAHLRSAARQYGKRQTGMAEKPDDCWVLPLCRTHHDEQHRHNELAWWASKGIPDPFAVAMSLYAGRPTVAQRSERPRKPHVASRLTKTERRPIMQRKSKIPQRINPWAAGRKFVSRLMSNLNRRTP